MTALRIWHTQQIFVGRFWRSKTGTVCSSEETALRFGVSKSSVSRWAKRLEPCLTRKKPATKIHPERLIRDAEQNPDSFHQHERAERYGCGRRGICGALKRLKISRGKTFFHPEADEEARRLFKKKAGVYELMRIPLIYIDESGFSEGMPRIFGYARAGVRCFGKHDSMPEAAD